MGYNKSRIAFIGLPAIIANVDLVSTLDVVAQNNNSRIVLLQYSFVPREKIRELNKSHLNHDYDTDVISFDYGNKDLVKGEVFVCEDVVEENALSLGVVLKEELLRVVFHGLLHLLGFNDNEESEKVEMKAAEEECLMLLKGN